MWLYKQADFHGFNDAIENYDWDTFFLDKDVNELTESVTKMYIGLGKRYILNKTDK